MLMLRVTPAIVEVSFSGRAKTAFRRNRIGLVVLHPTSEAGRDVSVVSPDGNVTAGAFPTDIRPDLVFTDISSLEWADAGTAFDLGFSGDIFETEDQRNWSDGSFKTYSTPSALPIPVDVAAGDTVTQSVSIEALSIETPDNPAPGGYDRVAFTVGEPAGTVPALALSVDPTAAWTRPERLPQTPGRERSFPASTPSWWNCTNPGSSGLPSLPPQPGRPTATAPRWMYGSFRRPPTAWRKHLSGALGGQLSRIVRLGLFHPETQCTDPAAFAALKEPLQHAGFSGQLLAGTSSHFTELNRWIAGGGSTPSRRTPTPWLSVSRRRSTARRFPTSWRPYPSSGSPRPMP